MEKYGVETGGDFGGKTASTSKTCPKCGSSSVTISGTLYKCKNCGTAPWEKRGSAENPWGTKY